MYQKTEDLMENLVIIQLSHILSVVSLFIACQLLWVALGCFPLSVVSLPLSRYQDDIFIPG